MYIAKVLEPGAPTKLRAQEYLDSMKTITLADWVPPMFITLSAVASKAAFWYYEKPKVKQQRKRA